MTKDCLINQKLIELKELLIIELQKHYVQKSMNDSFTDLIEAVSNIQTEETINPYNIKPTPMPQIDDSDLSSFYTSLYNRIRYYMRLLGYYLVLKGVPVSQINEKVDLKTLIGLVELIDSEPPNRILTLSSVIDDNLFRLTARYLNYNNSPMVNSYIMIKDIVSDNIVYEGYTNEYGEVYFNTNLGGMYQAFAYGIDTIVSDINIDNNGDLIITSSSIFDNNNIVISDVDDSDVIFKITFDEYDSNVDILTDVFFNNGYLFFNGDNAQNQTLYSSNIVRISSGTVYNSMSFNNGVLTFEDVDSLYIGDSPVLTSIRYDNGYLIGEEEPYTALINAITDITANDGVLTYTNINDI